MQEPDGAPMEIVLHIGPHKTGTTTVQQFLHDNLADDQPHPDHWYPRPERNGPGHAHLAWQTLGSPAHRTEASDALGMLVDRAAAAGTKRLVLSSEEFAWAYPRRTALLRAALRDHAVHLVMTLNPPLRRAMSSWQEMVKHGHPDSLADNPEKVLKRPGFRSDLLRCFVDGVQPASATVIVIEPDDPPGQLLQNVVDAMGLAMRDRIEDGAPLRRNRSLGFVDIELLRQLNLTLMTSAPDMPDEQRIRLRRTLMEQLLGSPEWQQARPALRPALPDNMRETLLEVAQATVADIAALRDTHRAIRIVGDLHALLQS